MSAFQFLMYSNESSAFLFCVVLFHFNTLSRPAALHLLTESISAFFCHWPLRTIIISILLLLLPVSGDEGKTRVVFSLALYLE